MIDDYRLIKQIQNDNQEALAALIEKYYTQVFGYCFRFFHGQKETAEDLTQDIFLKLVANIHHFHFTGKFSNYLFTITINTCRSRMTKKVLPQAEWKEEIADTPETTAPDMLNLDQIIVQKLLNQLPENQKEVLLLRFYYGLKLTEIAKITQAKLPTVKSRLQQGLKKLRKLATEEGLLE